MNSFESRKGLIGYEQALGLAFSNVRPMPEESCGVIDALGRTVSREVKAIVNLPSMDSSLKDGYAVLSSDIQTARPSLPVHLILDGISHAGQGLGLEVISGRTVRVLSGAPIPAGADAVLAEEFAVSESGIIKAIADAHHGRNILKTGAEIRRGQVLVDAGEIITPAKIALLVAGGVSDLYVFRMPSVGLLATGDEIILPGRPLSEGKLYCSNVVLQEAWLKSMVIKCVSEAWNWASMSKLILLTH